MPDVNSKSPRTAYASRSSEDKPNIAYPDGAVPVAGEEARAAVELADEATLPAASAAVNTTRLTAFKDALASEVAAEITDAGEEATVLITLDFGITAETVLALIDLTGTAASFNEER